MNVFHHVISQPFIAATGFAALVHSTWGLAVLFSGEPPAWEPGSPASWARWAYWLLPSLLIAFSLDIGQISTSIEIRAGERNRQKYATFIILALATYYLQWVYIVHHMPLLALGEGVYDGGLAGRIVLLMRNAAIWIIPAFLPLSTTLYTFSSGHVHHDVTEQKQSPVGDNAIIIQHDSNLLQSKPVTELLEDANAPVEEVIEPISYTARCMDCAWEKDGYANQINANRALSAHRKTCPTLHPELQVIPQIYTNGNGAKQ